MRFFSFTRARETKKSPRKGTTVSVYLPHANERLIPGTEVPTEPTVSYPDTGTVDSRKAVVLLVDDDTEVRAATAEMSFTPCDGVAAPSSSAPSRGGRRRMSIWSRLSSIRSIPAATGRDRPRIRNRPVKSLSAAQASIPNGAAGAAFRSNHQVGVWADRSPLRRHGGG
jgi:hypothetical protein